MQKELFQIKILLRGSKPPIWRRLIIPPDMLLPDSHKVIQTVMGWTNSHLHQFVKDKNFYSMPDEEDFMDRSSNTFDYSKIRVSDLLETEKDKIIYEYDFGDSWTHDIILEKTLPLEKEKYYPVCIDGKKSAPPEDIGGIPGYYQFLEARNDPNHELRDFFDPFLMEEFDPDDFDKEDINEGLKMKDYGCINFDDESFFLIRKR